MTKVRRAVFLAAGKGERLHPVTEQLPKPLVTVHGRRIIETTLDAVIAAGIGEIYIVRGYLAEAFDVLRAAYPMVRFLDNPFYDNANNISSILVARDYLEDAYIIESDLLLGTPSLIRSEEARTNYLTIPVAVTDDWCFFADSMGKITRMSATGGRHCDKMVGISFWQMEDARRLVRCAQQLWDEGKRQLFWDEVALGAHLGDFDVYVRRCRADDVTEIDTVEELCTLDSSYRSDIRSSGRTGE